MTLAQDGRLDEAMAALRHAERLALMVHAGDVVAIVCGNQANVAMMQHRHDQAMSLAERSVELQEEAGTPHGLGIALASLGQICVRLGNLTRAEQALNRALDVRSPLQFMRETTGAVFDTLAQIHLIRGNHEEASRCLQRSREAYGEYGAQTSRWYQWSVQVLEARLALRRGDAAQALDIATRLPGPRTFPPAMRCRRISSRSKRCSSPGRQDEAEDAAAATLASRLPASGMSGIWGEFLRLRGRVHGEAGRLTEAYHDLGQSVSVFELLGERYQAGLSYLELGQAGRCGGRAIARDPLPVRRDHDLRVAAGASRSGRDARRARAACRPRPPAGSSASQMDGDDALVRRIVDAAVTPALLAKEGHDRAARGVRRTGRGHLHPARPLAILRVVVVRRLRRSRRRARWPARPAALIAGRRRPR